MSRDNKDRLINLGLLIIAGICMLGAFASWCDARYAKESEIQEMKGEIQMIFEKIIPPAERRHS